MINIFKSILANLVATHLFRATKRMAVLLLAKPVSWPLRYIKRSSIVSITNGKLNSYATTSISQPEIIGGGRKSNEQLLYFTSSSLIKDDKSMIFLSDRTGHPNLFVRDLENEQERQLSNNTNGLLKSYVYFHGTPYRGLSKASPCVHHASGTVYYIQDNQIYKVPANGDRQVLAELPDGQMTAYTHVSSDGKLLCIPTVDEHALDGRKQLHRHPQYDIDERVRREGLSSYLRIYDTESGKEIATERIPKAWVTHVQFSPTNSNLILYNKEWAHQSGIRRMWLWDGKRHTQLRDAKDGRSADDWACHEIWSQDGQDILYHGKYTNGLHFIGKITLNTGTIIELPLPRGWYQYGHYIINEAGTLVTDGHFRAQHPKLTINCSWLCRVDVDWSRREMIWTPLTAHLSSWKSQDAHPHPIIDSVSKYVYFTSDKDGKLAVYRTPLF